MARLLALALLLPSAASAGAWTRAGGSYYTKAGADGFWALSWEQSGVDARDEDAFLGQQYSLYGEAGLPTGHPLQLSASVPVSIGTLWFVRRDNGARAVGRATVRRFGDLRLTPQVALHGSKPIALAVEVKLPMYQVDSVCDQDPTFRELCPRPGDGQIDIKPMILAGGGFGDKGFMEVGVGYLHRTEAFMGWKTDFEFGDSLVVSAGGGRWFGKVLPMLKLDANVAPKNDLVTAQSVRFGPSVLADVAEGVGLEARLQYDFWSVNAPQGLGFGVGIRARK